MAKFKLKVVRYVPQEEVVEIEADDIAVAKNSIMEANKGYICCRVLTMDNIDLT